MLRAKIEVHFCWVLVELGMGFNSREPLLVVLFSTREKESLVLEAYEVNSKPLATCENTTLSWILGNRGEPEQSKINRLF